MRRAGPSRRRVMALLALVGAACGEAHPAERLVIGEVEAVQGGEVRSWAVVAPDGGIAGVGVSLAETALASFRPERDTALTLALPAAAVAAGFDHLELHWVAVAADEDPIFTRPRFDIRFFLVSPRVRDGIREMGGPAPMPPLEAIPQGYIPTAGLLPRAGAHWIDPTAPEFTGQPFATSILYGFHEGRMVFIEPRVARDFLESRPAFSARLRLPQRTPMPDAFPTGYRVRYDAAAREYSIALERHPPG